MYTSAKARGSDVRQRVRWPVPGDSQPALTVQIADPTRTVPEIYCTSRVLRGPRRAGMKPVHGSVSSLSSHARSRRYARVRYIIT